MFISSAKKQKKKTIDSWNQNIGLLLLLTLLNFDTTFNIKYFRLLLKYFFMG